MQPRTSPIPLGASTKAYLQLTATAALWGLSWVCGRIISSQGVPAISGSLGRFYFASAGLFVVMLVRRSWPRVDAGTAVRLFAMGFFGVVLYNVCFFNGLRTVPAGRASLMAALQPSVVFLFSALVWGERVTLMKISGLIVSLLGAVLVLSQGDPARLFQTGLHSGDLWVIACVSSWVAYTLLSRTVAGRLPWIPATAYSTWLGTGLLLTLSLIQPVPSPARSSTVWMAIVFLGIGGTTVAFALFLSGIGRIGPARATIFLNLVPVFGVAFSSLLLGESISGTTLLGGGIVLVGVRLLNW